MKRIGDPVLTADRITLTFGGITDEFGTMIALIEHDMGVVMDISDRVVVLDYGRKIADGPPDEVRASPEVIAAYLGEPDQGEVRAASASARRSVAM